MTTALEIKWTTSRGRETYGYNLVKLTDMSTDKVFRCLGGGYDMTGTVFGEWLTATHYDDLVAIADRAHGGYILDGETYTRRPNNDAPDSLYGLTSTTHAHGGITTVQLDGACGLSSMERIAEAIGLKVSHVVNRHGNVTMFLVDTVDGK